jgi:hypothetical protein
LGRPRVFLTTAGTDLEIVGVSLTDIAIPSYLE